MALARRGYLVVTQDVRGTGDSEPDSWDFYIYEREDSFDFIEWVVQQPWYSGFIGSLGGSYVGGTQWCMAMHPRMTAIAPEVAGLGIAPSNGVRFHLYINSYSKSVGKGAGKVAVDHNEVNAGTDGICDKPFQALGGVGEVAVFIQVEITGVTES